MKIRLTAALAVSLTGILAPSAMGATLVSDRPCYRENARANFVGSGFPPGQEVAVSLDGQQISKPPDPPPVANSLGQVAGFIRSLTPIPGSEQARTLTMAQVANPTLRTAVVFRETKVAVVATLNRVRGGRSRFRARGFYGADNAPRTLYAHVRGPRRRNVRIGSVRGPCGKVSTARVAISRRGDPRGNYTLQFDTVRSYIGRRAVPRIFGTFRIGPIFGSSSRHSLFSPFPERGGAWEPLA